MKSSPFSRSGARSGFTLVELLVVIGIIAILASVIFSVGSSAIRAAERVKAAQIANSLQTACVNYYSEYNTYPVPTGTNGDLLIADNDTTTWPILIDALCGNINPLNAQTVAPTTIANSRNIAFLNMKPADITTAGAPKNPLPYSANNPTFNIAFDSDYDNIVGDSGSAKSTLIDFVNSKNGQAPTTLTTGTSGGVAVWANCNTTTTVAKWNYGFFVHTY